MKDRDPTGAEPRAVALDPALHAIMRTLSPVEQQIFECRFSTQPPRSITRVAALLGKNRATVASHWKHIRDKIGFDPAASARELGMMPKATEIEVGEPLRAVSPEVLTRLLEMRAEAMLRAMTVEKIEKAELGELARSVKELLGQRALLRGEPTQILSVHHRSKMMDMMPLLLKEAARRGYELAQDQNGELRELKFVGKEAARAKTIEAEASPV